MLGYFGGFIQASHTSHRNTTFLYPGYSFRLFCSIPNILTEGGGGRPPILFLPSRVSSRAAEAPWPRVARRPAQKCDEKRRKTKEETPRAFRFIHTLFRRRPLIRLLGQAPKRKGLIRKKTSEDLCILRCCFLSQFRAFPQILVNSSHTLHFRRLLSPRGPRV